MAYRKERQLILKLQPDYGKWKFAGYRRETLIASCPDGQFLLDNPSGIPTVIFPEKSLWSQVAPDWAKDDWDDLHFHLNEWCAATKQALHVGGWTDLHGNWCEAKVYPTDLT